jgi:hypothetical protein
MRSSSALGTLALLLSARPALADAIDGPALVAWAPSYHQHVEGAPTHGAGCLNKAERMPVDRAILCRKPVTQELEVGRYQITVTNGAPFPTLQDDSGYLLFVATVGGNAQCFEEQTVHDGHDLTSIVRCVAPDGAENVSTDFDWTYRADSTNFPQYTPYIENFAYASVRRDGELDAEGSFNPMNLHAEDIAVERTGTGRYAIVFRDLNPGDALLDSALAPYSVIVQKTCAGDWEGAAEPEGCFGAVCSVLGSSPGDFEQRDTSVDVACMTGDGAPRDTSFRVFFGQDGFTSQGSWEGGFRYGWLTYDVESDELDCREGDELSATSQHETPLSHYLGFPVRACRDGRGLYSVDFLGETVLPYSIDGLNFAVSRLGEGPGYCNIRTAECASWSLCGLPDGPPLMRLTLGCFDAQGEAVDTTWNLNVTY